MNFSCFIFGHKYKFVERISDQSDKVECTRCGKLFAINYNVRVILPWDRELEKFYEQMEEFKAAL